MLNATAKFLRRILISTFTFDQMAEKSKILIIGATGCIGKYLVEASAKAGHPTFALVRESTVLSDPVEAKLVESFRNLGVTILHGDLYDHESLVKAIKQVDVVISAVGHMQLADQHKIIAAIKEAGNIKLLCKAKALYAEISSAIRRIEDKSSSLECELSDTT